MKNIYFNVLGVLALAATAASCTQKIELTQGAIDQTAIVTTCVKSSSSELPMEGVQISPLANLSDSVLTDKQGFAKMSVQAGAHKFRFAATGYASIFETINVAPLNGQSETPIFGEIHEDVVMYPLNGTLKGRVVLNGADGQDNAYAQDATVQVITVENKEIADPIETKTSADGLFSFVVPTMGQLQLLVRYTSPSGAVYQGRANTSLVDGETQTIQSVFLSASGATNFDKADIVAVPKLPSDLLRVTFPVAIDRNKTVSIVVNRTQIPLINITLTDGDRTLGIPSNETDKKWVIGNENTFGITAFSAEGGTLVENGLFTVK